MTRRAWVAALAVALLALTAACGGTGDRPRKADATTDPDTVVRWPRYWLTTDTAESGADGSSNAEFFIGDDGDRLIYNAEDVVRVLDRDTGKQVHRTLTARGEVICAVQQNPTLADHTLVLATGKRGSSGDQSCRTVRGYDVRSGTFTWSYRLSNPGDLTLAVRDDRVVVGSEIQSPKDYDISYQVAALDLGDGTVAWKQSAADAWRRDEKTAGLDDCAVQPGIAAARPVVVAVATCRYYDPDNYTSNDDDDTPRIAGFDLDSGKRLWLTKASWLKVGEDGTGLPGDLRPHPNDGAFIAANRYVGASYVDPRTGKGRLVKDPDVVAYQGSEDNSYEACGPFGSDSGNSYDDLCVFPAAGGTLVYVAKLSEKNSGRLRVDGLDEQTGKTRWRVDLRYTRDKKRADQGYEVLGLDTTRRQLLVATDASHVSRYDVRTGKRVGRALLAPPLGLTKFAVAGPGWLAVRNQGGITSTDGSGVPSGLDYYRTNTGG